jgi:transcriptional regulator with XRE-family HTH domain
MELKVCDRLKQVRQTLGYTQLEFARTAGIPRSTYTKFELGRNIPKIVYVNCICDRYHINQEWLLTGEGTMFRGEERPDWLQVSLVALYNTATPAKRAEIRKMIISMAAQQLTT